MIDKKFWEEQLQNLDKNELNEVIELVNNYKESVDSREEFMDLLKRYHQMFPNAKYFFSGSAWKGAYECEGEWGTNEWYDTYNIKDVWDNLIDYVEEDDEEHGDIEILSQFNSSEEWKNSLLNTYIKRNNSTREVFTKELNNSIHKPVFTLDDADGLNNGDDMYELIDLETGEKKYLYTNSYRD